MTKAQIVVGANFGDEGKGLVTDYLTHKPHKTIVIRHNGGSQAGHTVLTPDRRRHVFGHIGAGSFNGCPTYLSEYFIVNPMMLLKEYAKLKEETPIPPIYIDKRAPLTTPYDMLLNQAVEQSRDNLRHGSCGIGINETITRIKNSDFDCKTIVHDIFHPIRLREKLVEIRDNYVPARAKQLGITLTQQHIDLIQSDSLLTNYLHMLLDLLPITRTVSSEAFLEDYEHLVFEGAQGLLLDEYHKWFPHVTRSKTGVHNAVSILKNIHIESADVYYVTRTYLTRHGAGPLPYEYGEQIYSNIVDETNVNNPFQGPLRFAPLNLDLLQESIAQDHKASRLFHLRPHLVLTCQDQIMCDTPQYILNDELQTVEAKDFPDVVSEIYPFTSKLVSCGPTRSSVVKK